MQLAENGAQPFVACTLRAAVPGQVDGVVQRLSHGVVGIHQHAGDASLLRQVGHQPGRYHCLYPGRTQCLHAGGRVVRPPVAELPDAHAEQGIQLRQVLRRALERHQAHSGRDGARSGQRAHQVEAAHLHHRHRNVQVLPQPFATGARGHHRIDGGLGVQRAHRLHGVAESMRDQLDLRLCGDLRYQPRQHAAQPVAGHRDDVKWALRCGRMRCCGNGEFIHFNES
ncbi:hypothetical protein D9M72_519080 [compost metagenome]